MKTALKVTYDASGTRVVSGIAGIVEVRVTSAKVENTLFGIVKLDPKFLPIFSK